MSMFCFQCEQTAGCTGCTGKVGVCGKTDETANLQDKLTGALVGLARLANGENPGEKASRVMIEGLFTTITNVNFDNEAIYLQIEKVREEIGRASCRERV